MEDFYRGKRLDNGKWVYGGLIKTLEGYFIYPDDAKITEAEQTVKDEYTNEEYRIKGHLIETVEVDETSVDRVIGIEDDYSNLLFENDFITCKFHFKPYADLDDILPGWDYDYCGLVTVKDGRLSLYPEVPEIKTVEDFKNYIGNFEIIGSLHDEEKIVEQAIELAKALNIQNTTKAMEYEFNYRKNKLFTITRQITL